MVVPNSAPLVNYTTLNLRHNSLVQVNFSVLREQLPNLKIVDLRDNPFDYKGFPDKTIFGVITDCEIAMTRNTLKTTRLKSSHAGTPTRKTLKTRKLAQTATTRLPLSHPGTSIIIYMTVLVSSVSLMPIIILCLKGVVKLCKTRHRTRTLPISFEFELSLFNFDADSEEHVIFDATAL